MNTETWLRRATDGLPDTVSTRIAQETQEHLADAGLDRDAEVDHVLGAPENTAKALTRLYLTEAELDKLNRDLASFSTLKDITGVFTLCMTYLAFVQPYPLPRVMTLLYIVGLVMA